MVVGVEEEGEGITGCMAQRLTINFNSNSCGQLICEVAQKHTHTHTHAWVRVTACSKEPQFK